MLDPRYLGSDVEKNSFRNSKQDFNDFLEDYYRSIFLPKIAIAIQKRIDDTNNQSLLNYFDDEKKEKLLLKIMTDILLENCDTKELITDSKEWHSNLYQGKISANRDFANETWEPLLGSDKISIPYDESRK